MRRSCEEAALFDGIKAVLALVAAGAKGGRPTNEHLPIGRVLLGSACLYLKKGQYADAARLLDTTRRAIANTNTAVAVDNLNTEGLLLTPAQVISLLSSMKTTHIERSIGARTRSRCAVDVTGDGSADAQPSCYYEVRGKSRKEISHLCRLGLDYRCPQQVAPGAGTCAGAGAGTDTGAGARGAHSLAAFFPPR